MATKGQKSFEPMENSSKDTIFFQLDDGYFGLVSYNERNEDLYVQIDAPGGDKAFYYKKTDVKAGHLAAMLPLLPPGSVKIGGVEHKIVIPNIASNGVGRAPTVEKFCLEKL